MSEERDLAAYRSMLVDTMRFLNEAYDKILVTLAGGALVLSIAFLKDVIDLENVTHAGLLVASWIGFILSLAAVLGRILFGIEAYRRAIAQVDQGTIYRERAGGRYSRVTRALHVLSALSLVVGLSCIAVFSYLNVWS
jgi:hypothetical protein